MLALPPAPQQAPKRQLFVGTALASAAGTMLLGGMLAVWLQFRADAPYRESARRGLIKDWMPEKPSGRCGRPSVATVRTPRWLSACRP